jgi:hypothetical protein
LPPAAARAHRLRARRRSTRGDGGDPLGLLSAMGVWRASHALEALMNGTSIRAAGTNRWMSWTGMAAGGVALLAVGGVAGVPLAGWPGALVALVFAAAITIMLAYVFTRSH